MTDNYTPAQQKALREAEAARWEMERANHALDVDKRLRGGNEAEGKVAGGKDQKGQPAKNPSESSQKAHRK